LDGVDVDFTTVVITAGMAGHSVLSSGSVRSVRRVMMLSVVVACWELVRLTMMLERTWTRIRGHWSSSALARRVSFVLMLRATCWERLESLRYFYPAILIEEIEVSFAPSCGSNGVYVWVR
jgi:hypothetical protein